MKSSNGAVAFAGLAVALASLGCLGGCGSSKESDQSTRLQSLDQVHDALVTSRRGVESDLLHAAWVAAKEREQSNDGPDAFVNGVWQMFDASRVGHSGLYAVDDTPTVSPSGILRPRSVTFAGQPWGHVPLDPGKFVALDAGFLAVNPDDGNAYGFRKGDTLVAIGDARGATAMTDIVLGLVTS